MVKKLLLFFVAMMPFFTLAQQDDGTWITHSRFNMTAAKNVIDAGENVYFLANNNLFCYNKGTETQRRLTKKSGELSDNLVKNIYYNYDKKYLAIAYHNGNVDVLKSDGKFVNIPVIKDAVLSREKTVNDISFADNKMYVATPFGYIVVDDDKFQLTTSIFMDLNVNSAAEINGYTLLSIGNYLFYAVKPKTAHAFKRIGLNGGCIYPIDNNSFFLKQPYALFYCDLDFSGGIVKVTPTQLEASIPDYVQKTNKGFLVNFMADGFYYTFDKAGHNGVKVNNEGGKMVSCNPLGDGTMWTLDAQGLKKENSQHYSTPNAVKITEIPFWLSYNEHTQKMYLSNTADNGQMPAFFSSAYEMDMFDGTSWHNLSLEDMAGSEGWYNPVFDPNDKSDTYYISARYGGLFKMKGNKVVTVFNSKNFPFVERKAAIQFDAKGNLWAVHSSLNNRVPVKVLPKEKLNKSNISVNDWVLFPVKNVTDFNSFKYSMLSISKGSDVKAFCCGDYETPLIFWKNGANVTSQNGFVQKTRHFLPCDDGSSFLWTFAYALTPDKKDNMMFGTKEGLVWFEAAKVFDEDFVAHKVKVFNGIQINAIAVDAANRKWVGTKDDGIYLYDEDFSHELKHFTVENSGLASNVIYQLCCNTANNSVFITSPMGVQQYFDKSSSATDYANVTVTPNPIRPDYTGMIVIAGLMNDSHVVIKDATGHVMKTLLSKGGSVVWDGCDERGERLPTGNYSVFASQSGTIPSKPCAKVMLIK